MSWHDGHDALIISIVILSGPGTFARVSFLRLLSYT